MGISTIGDWMKISALLRSSFSVACSALALTVGFDVPALAETKVGKAAQIQNEVTGSSGNRRLKVSDAVFGEESIVAGAASHGEILLDDQSRVIVGENSSIRLDDFVVAPDGFQSATVNVAKGAFRFVTGNSRKGTFKIATPLGSIGIRGTVFDVYVGEGGKTDVVLLQGALTVCAKGGSCLIAERRCDVITIPAAGQIERSPFFLSRERSGAGTREMNLLFRQERFPREWRAPTLACSARASQEALDNPRGDRRSPGDEPPEPPEPPDEGNLGPNY
jgi:hypothetical protein